MSPVETEGSLQRYVALLRAVNVGGSTVMKMADLRSLFESLGLVDVSTYIQTGNILFATAESDEPRLARRLEAAVAAAAGHDVTVFVLTTAELKAAAARNPFRAEARSGGVRSHLMFLSAPPEPARWEALRALQGEEYRFHRHDNVLYYAYGREWAGRRRTIDFEKVLGVVGTARSWNVVDKLIELADSQ